MASTFVSALPIYFNCQTCIRFLLSFGGILFVQYMCCTWRSLMKFLVMAGPLSRPFPHCYFYKQKRLSLYCGKLYSPSRPIFCWLLGVDFHVWKKGMLYRKFHIWVFLTVLCIKLSITRRIRVFLILRWNIQYSWTVPARHSINLHAFPLQMMLRCFLHTNALE